MFQFDIVPSEYIPSFDSGRITVTANTIALNWQRLSYDAQSPDRDGDGVAVAARAIPEPGLLSIVALGLLGLLGAAPLRRSQSSSLAGA